MQGELEAMRVLRIAILATALMVGVVSCQESSLPGEPTAVAALPATPTEAALPTATPVPTTAAPTWAPPTPTLLPSPTPLVSLALAPDLPEDVVSAALAWAAARGVVLAEGDGVGADLRLDLAWGPDAALVGETIYVPVARFATLREETTLDELWQLWSGAAEAGRLLMTAATATGLGRLWGAPADTVELLPDDELTAALWQDEQAMAIVPFDRLEPRMAPLWLEGLSAVDNRLRQSEWPLALRVWLHGSGADATALLHYVQRQVPVTNRDPGKLTVLVMTGVTAMARGTACKIEELGDYAYPAHVVGPELAAADITHISNEIPFVSDCVARCDPDVLELCSKPEYMAALVEVGVDIVGLTGNHLNDFGQHAALASLQLYEEHELPVYGGGANDETARQPLYLTHNGNRLAFLGANQYGPDAVDWYPQGAWATADNPGSARFELEAMKAAIAAVRPQVDVVSVEIQYTEAYQTGPLAAQMFDFEALSAAGADIVTGVQAHQPQSIEFTDQGLILYGLGNLFFDQMDWWETRQGLIARHAIYDGRHISTELLVTILEDWAQPRWATTEERAEVLLSVFAASGW
jgi:hypothetical protein